MLERRKGYLLSMMSCKNLKSGLKSVAHAAVQVSS
jgi:hypothetical protein